MYKAQRKNFHRERLGGYTCTINREYFIVKIFSDSLDCAKIKRAKIHA